MLHKHYVYIIWLTCFIYAQSLTGQLIMKNVSMHQQSTCCDASLGQWEIVTRPWTFISTLRTLAFKLNTSVHRRRVELLTDIKSIGCSWLSVCLWSQPRHMLYRSTQRRETGGSQFGRNCSPHYVSCGSLYCKFIAVKRRHTWFPAVQFLILLMYVLLLPRLW